MSAVPVPGRPVAALAGARWPVLVALVMVVGAASCGGESAGPSSAASAPSITDATSPPSDSPPSDSSPSDSSPSDSSPTIPAGDQPALTIGLFDRGHPMMWLPRDLHGLVLYPDGTLVLVDASARTAVSLIGTSIPAESISAVLEVADQAGLGDGTTLPVEPSALDVVDGGWTIVTRRSDRGVGQIVVDQLGVDGEQPSERRALLRDLVAQVARSADRDVGTWREVPIERWAIESAQPLDDLTSVEWPWPELDPNAFMWEFNDEGVRCTIVADGDWPYTDDEAQDWEALRSGVFRRPLLPHESSCDDVFHWRDVLGLSGAMILVPAGLEATS